MITDHDAIYKRFYSDPKYNKTSAFFALIRQHCGSETRLLNLGEGPATANATCSLKGEVAEVVGADIDPVVLTNHELDRAVVITDYELPFDNSSFDLAFSDYVLEHVEHPLPFLAEVYRVLKLGSSYIFRTPNIYHYVSLVSRTTPHWFHVIIADRVRGLSEEAHEPWPTFYRLNSRRTIRCVAAKIGFQKITLQMVEGHPSYLVFHSLPFLVGVAYERLVNSSEVFAVFRANIFGQLTK